MLSAENNAREAPHFGVLEANIGQLHLNFRETTYVSDDYFSGRVLGR